VVGVALCSGECGRGTWSGGMGTLSQLAGHLEEHPIGVGVAFNWGCLCTQLGWVGHAVGVSEEPHSGGWCTWLGWAGNLVGMGWVGQLVGVRELEAPKLGGQGTWWTRSGWEGQLVGVGRAPSEGVRITRLVWAVNFYVTQLLELPTVRFKVCQWVWSVQFAALCLF
jgi:hypothetical protein